MRQASDTNSPAGILPSLATQAGNTYAGQALAYTWATLFKDNSLSVLVKVSSCVSRVNIKQVSVATGIFQREDYSSTRSFARGQGTADRHVAVSLLRTSA